MGSNFQSMAKKVTVFECHNEGHWPQLGEAWMVLERKLPSLREGLGEGNLTY